MILYLIQGIMWGSTAAIMPGPFHAFLLSQTLKLGWKRAIWAAFGPILSDIPIIILVLAILTQTPNWLLSLIQIGGGFFILYLAWGAYTAYRATEDASIAVDESTQSNLFKAIVVGLLNPNPYLFWGTTLGPIFIRAWRESQGFGVGFMLGFYVAIVSGFALFVLAFASAGRLGPGVTRILNGVSALALFCFGLYQLWAGGTGLMG